MMNFVDINPDSIISIQKEEAAPSRYHEMDCVQYKMATLPISLQNISEDYITAQHTNHTAFIQVLFFFSVQCRTPCA